MKVAATSAHAALVSIFAGVVGVFGLVGIGCKDAASTVVEKGVSAAKETSKGIEEGVDKGRKTGESLDGALLVSSPAELEGKGSVSVYSVHALDGSTEAEISLAFENTTDKPLRVTKLQIVVLDAESFAKRPSGVTAELTVAPKAKEKLTFRVEGKAATLAKVRVWDKDYEIGPAARK
jgi:hypothetical protein